ncbi:hypothetical protein [Zunongwangia sp.]|uniref:hypothetical protein n=1 Tax=Zunongwangia sp. TaxID=1965325 RepID=UPI003AA929B8
MIVAAIFCMTFLLVLVAYWIMPTEKMQAVNKELKSLLQVLPVSKIIKALKKEKKKDESDDTSKEE